MFGLKRGLKYLYKWAQRNDYQTWIRLYDQLDESQEAIIRNEIDGMTSQPKISIIMLLNDAPLNDIRETIESLCGQWYQNWELCIAVDTSAGNATLSLLQDYANQDARINVVATPLKDALSAAANRGLDLALGDYVALIGNADVLPPQALFYIAQAIASHPEAAMIFSDEDKISQSGVRYDPWFKCELNYELLLSQNAIGHLTVYRRDLIKDLEGFRVGFESAQDYDLALRALERIDATQVIHIPRILYHQRTRPRQTAAATEAARRAVADHLVRTDRGGVVEPVPEAPQYNRVRYPLPPALPLVSIIIPTRDRANLLGMCLDSLLAKTTYTHYEIIIVDNGSVEASTQALFARLPKDRISIIHDDAPFNYSRLNNLAVAQAKGDVICLMNNDIEIFTPDWMQEMLSYASQPDIGCVGARLWFPDGRLQHAGVITGLGGVAGHPNKFFPRGYSGYFGRAVLAQSMSAVTAACLMVCREIWEKVQGLDENLAVAFNDVDFCLRIRAAGYRNVWTPFAEMIHHESASRGDETTPEKQERYLKEIEQMKSRWGDLLNNDPAYNPNLTLAHDDFSLAWPPRNGCNA
jgi:GT2 family glycosyltransferase